MFSLKFSKKCVSREESCLYIICGRFANMQLKKFNFQGDTGSPVVTRIFVGRVQEKTTVDTLRKFFNGEAAKIDPNAFVSCHAESYYLR